MEFLWRHFWNCAERGREAGVWVEPVNVSTSLAFLVVAGLLWRNAMSSGDVVSRRIGGLFAVQTGLVGAGSVIFHLYANGLGLIVDAAFVLILVHTLLPLFMIRVLGWRVRSAALAMGVFGVMQLAPRLFSNKVMWWHLVAATGLLVIALLAKRYQVAARRQVYLATFAVIFALLCHRLDRSATPWLACGTHFLWHLGTATGLYLLASVTIRPHPAPHSVLLPDAPLTLVTTETPVA